MSKPIISVAEELNIFSELPVTLFDRKRNTQISDTLTRFKDIFFKYIMKNNIKCPLPKLHHSVDDDSNLVKIGIKRNNVIATLYFSFEKEKIEMQRMTMPNFCINFLIFPSKKICIPLRSWVA